MTSRCDSGRGAAGKAAWRWIPNVLQRALTVALLASLAALQLLLQPAEAACILRLELDAQASQLSLTSGNLLVPLDPTSGTNLSSPATFSPAVPRGLSGALYAVARALPACPAAADRAAWLAAWPAFNLTSTAPNVTYSEPITVYPALHLGATSFAGKISAPKYDYNVSSLRASFQVAGFAAGSTATSFTAAFTTQLAEGWLRSYSFVTGTRTDNLQNVTADATAVAVSVDVLVVSGSHTLVVDVPALNLTYQAVGTLDLFGGAYRSFANYTLSTRMRATAVLDCGSDGCGDYGRCELVNGTAQCVCDCGWSADSSQKCNLPWGYCDATGGIVAQASAAAPPPPPPPHAPASASACLTNVSVSPVNGSCPVGYDWDANGVLCSACPAGFSGTGCAMCATDAACRSRLSSSTAQCSSSPLYQPRSTLKSYTCKVLDPNMAAIVGTTLDFTCSTKKPALNASLSTVSLNSGLVINSSPVNSTPYCSLSFRLAGMPRDAAVQCTGWACEFGVGSSKVYCPLVKCACPKGCSSGVVSEATFSSLRTDVSVACGSEAGKGPQGADGLSSCAFSLGGLPIPAIPASCRTAECLDPVNGSLAVSEASSESKAPLAVAPIIAWVPSMVLLLAAAATAAAVASFHHMAGPPHKHQPKGHNAAGAPPTATAVAPAGPVAEGEEAPALTTPVEAGVDGGIPLLGEAQQQRQLEKPPRPFLPVQLGNSAAGDAASGGSGTASGSGNGSGGEVAGKELLALAGRDAAGVEAEARGLRLESGVASPGADRPLVQVLSWHGLHLSTRPHRSALPPWQKRPAVTLLRDVSGRAASGEILGILGPSGSGKTTLLNVLSGLIQPGTHWRLAGCVALDGRTVARHGDLAALVGHVPQHDLLARSLTVAECVAASAALRMSWGELSRGRAHVQARVTSVLRELGISHLAHRVVWPGGGAPLSGSGGATGGGGGGAGTLSGGERLRVAASLELVSDPPILMLDEPLSGLDSATARATMAVLRGVAVGGGGRVVVASLHQPSPALFSCLDSVLLMAGGRVAAAGPPGGLAAVLAAAAVPPPPPDVHIAEHLLDLVAADPGTAARLCDFWQGSVAGAVTGSAGGGDDDTGYVRSLVVARGGGASAGVALRRLGLELGVVTWRGGLDLLRNPTMLALHLGVTAALGLLVGAVFSNTDLNVSGAQNRVGSIFFSVMLLACFATSAVDGLYPERPAVDRDLLRISYGILPYMASRLVLDALLLRVLPAWAYSLPFYWLMGLRRQAAAFLTFLGAFTTMACLSGAACIALSCMFSSPGRAVLLLNLLLLTAALFSGFLANKDSIVVWLRWIVYLSPIRFCWESLVINELRPLVLTFSSPDLPQGLPAVKGSLFLSLLGVNPNNLITDLIVLGCMYAIVAGTATVAGAVRLAALRGRWG